MKSSDPPKLFKMGRCPACAAATHTHPIMILTDFSVYGCGCGIKFIDPSLDDNGQVTIYQNSETLARINPALLKYYEYETLESGSQTVKDYERALTEISDQCSGRDLCEIGCGAGGFLAHAKSRGWKVLGIDSSADNVARTISRGVDAVQTDIFRYVTERHFDAVVLWDVLEHPQYPAKLLTACSRLLKPDGCLLIAVPYDPNVISLLAFFLYKISFGKIKSPAQKWYVTEHTSYFSKKGLKGLFDRNQLRVMKWWKTETDLSRYGFSFWERQLLEILFLIGRIFDFQNRLILVARKV